MSTIKLSAEEKETLISLKNTLDILKDKAENAKLMAENARLVAENAILKAGLAESRLQSFSLSLSKKYNINQKMSLDIETGEISLPEEEGGEDQSLNK